MQKNPHIKWIAYILDELGRCVQELDQPLQTVSSIFWKQLYTKNDQEWQQVSHHEIQRFTQKTQAWRFHSCKWRLNALLVCLFHSYNHRDTTFLIIWLFLDNVTYEKLHRISRFCPNSHVFAQYMYAWINPFLQKSWGPRKLSFYFYICEHLGFHND